MTDGKPPIIGVTSPDRGGAAAWWFTRFAVWLAGGHAVRVTPRRPRTIDGLHGLIIGGGADVDPTLYGQELLHVTEKRKRDEAAWLWVVGLILFPLTWLIRKLAAAPVTTGQDPARDALEMRLIDQAVQRRLPILGICRGAQLINVYFGGTLHQGLAGLYVEDPEIRTILPRKRIGVEDGSCLAAVLGRQPVRVNALHRQAIDRLGRGIRIAARDRNGIVQAIEHDESLPLVVGVQWHPEYLPQMPQQRALFRQLVRTAARGERAATDAPCRPPRAAAVLLAALLPLLSGCAQRPPPSPPVEDVGPTSGSLDNHELGGIVFDTPLDWSDFHYDGWSTWAWRKRDPASGELLVDRQARTAFGPMRNRGRAKRWVNAALRKAGVTGEIDWIERRGDLRFSHTALLRLSGDRFGVFAIVRGVESPTLWLHALVLRDSAEADATAQAREMLAGLRAELADGTNPPRTSTPDAFLQR